MGIGGLEVGAFLKADLIGAAGNFRLADIMKWIAGVLMGAGIFIQCDFYFGIGIV